MGHIAGSESFRGSIWIRPSGLALETLQDAIRRIQRANVGPDPWPHVTLIGGIQMSRAEAERRLRRLAAGFLPFNVKLGRLDGHPDYFRSFFAHVEPSDELLALHRRAMEVFDLPVRDPYEPHVSLLYGEIDEATRRMLAAELGGALDVTFRASSIHLVDATRSKPVEQWRPLLECPLTYRETAEGSASVRDVRGPQFA